MIAKLFSKQSIITSLMNGKETPVQHGVICDWLLDEHYFDRRGIANNMENIMLTLDTC